MGQALLRPVRPGHAYSGSAPTWDEVVYRGDPKAREFVAFCLKDGRVVAGMNVNVWDVAEPIQALIRSQHPVDMNRPRRELGGSRR